MAEHCDLLQNPEGFAGLHTCVKDAIFDWQELYESKMDSFNRECSGRDAKAPPLPHPDQDSVRAELLEQLITLYFVRFEEWVAKEVLTFAILAYPRQNLRAVTEEGKHSEFFAVLHGNWKPRVLEWVYFLWEFVGRACELFADVIYLMPDNQRRQPPELGRVLFKDMIALKLAPPGACASFIGALVLHPYERTYARQHEETIYLHSGYLKAKDMGFMCRSLLMYRSRDPERCECGYRRGESECKCSEKQLRHESTGNHETKLPCDRDKRYAAILMKFILDRYGIQTLEGECQWTRSERDEFVRSACENVFSVAVCNEIHQILQERYKRGSEQQSVRQETKTEEREHATWSCDNSDSLDIFDNMWCVSPVCDYVMRSNCVNLSCKRHCRDNGRKVCRPHENFNVRPLSFETKRKGIMPGSRRLN